MMTVAELLAEAQHLSEDERKELARQIIDTLGREKDDPARRSLSELRGLGKEVWQDIDTERYVHTMRDEWDKHA